MVLGNSHTAAICMAASAKRFYRREYANLVVPRICSVVKLQPRTWTRPEGLGEKLRRYAARMRESQLAGASHEDALRAADSMKQQHSRHESNGGGKDAYQPKADPGGGVPAVPTSPGVIRHRRQATGGALPMSSLGPTCTARCGPMVAPCRAATRVSPKLAQKCDAQLGQSYHI